MPRGVGAGSRPRFEGDILTNAWRNLGKKSGKRCNLVVYGTWSQLDLRTATWLDLGMVLVLVLTPDNPTIRIIQDLTCLMIMLVIATYIPARDLRHTTAITPMSY